MVDSPQGRGFLDTGRRLDRPFARALVIALVLHAPLVPSRLADWARLSFFGSTADYDDPDASAIIPLDLDLLARDPVAEPTAAPPPPAPPPVPPAPTGDAVLDGGAPKPRPDAGPPDAGPPTDAGTPPRPIPDAGPPDAGPPDAPPKPVADPLTAAGGAGKIAAKDPNVQLLLSGRALRKHTLGPWLGRLLKMAPGWRQFFEASPLDPVQDFDHLLITAPRLKDDSSKMVAILATSLSSDQVHEVVDQVLHRTDGVWLEDAPVTAARARVAGAPRLFAWLPEKKLLVILPGNQQDQLDRLKRAKPFRNSSEGLVVSLLTPARPFHDFLELPESLKWMRLALTPTPDGGADLAIEAGDASWQDAERHAEVLTREIDRRRKVDVLGITSVEILDPVTFTTSGDTIRGRVHIQLGQLRQIMAYVEQQARARWGAAPR